MPLDEHTAFHLANLFSALSDSTRIRIIDLLLEGEQSVGAMAEQLGINGIVYTKTPSFKKQLKKLGIL